jgi:hypothetical protein
MTFFSMENGRYAGNTKALAISHLFIGDAPLICGLFSDVGRPLTLLSDGIELRTAVLVMESLTLAAVDWMEPVHELLTDSQASAEGCLLSPEEILSRVAYDGRFSGVMKGGPGFHEISHVFSNPNAKAAIVECMQRLDTRDPALLLQQLAALSVLLACATHKPGQPAFDLYLGRLPTCVHSARVILEEGWVEDDGHRVLLVRGLWLVMLLAYVTQLRPVIDGKLLVSKEVAEENRSWEAMYEELRSKEAAAEGGRHRDFQFLRAVRSLRELSKAYESVHGRLYFHAACKLMSQWRRWTGLGISREEMLNIRL